MAYSYWNICHFILLSIIKNHNAKGKVVHLVATEDIYLPNFSAVGDISRHKCSTSVCLYRS